MITGPVVVGNVGDNSVGSYRLRAPETQQLAVPHSSVICVKLLGDCRQPVTGRLATLHSNTPVKRYIGHGALAVQV